MNDECFAALASRDRRRLLVGLLKHTSQTIADLQDPTDMTGPDEKSSDFAITMVHIHLPMLADGGFIDWDRKSNTVVTGPRFEELRPLLALLDEHQNTVPAKRL